MTTGTENDVKTVLAELSAAMHRRDAAAVTAMHDPDAVIYDLAPPLGDRPDAGKLAAWLSGWGGPVDETWRDPEIVVSGDLATCFGLAQVATHSKSGEEVRWWMRRTMVLRWLDNGWRIVHDHTSVPFYMDGSERAATDLLPPGIPADDATEVQR